MRDHGRVRSLRLSLIAVAVAACAWFVVVIRQAHEIDSATRVIERGSSASRAELSGAAAQLGSARFLNPGQAGAILRGRLAIAEHRSGDARRILEDVTRAEPLNLDSWIWLAGASFNDRHESSVALAHIAQLDPRDAAAPH